jgi:hypothetical protein
MIPKGSKPLAGGRGREADTPGKERKKRRRPREGSQRRAALRFLFHLWVCLGRRRGRKPVTTSMGPQKLALMGMLPALLSFALHRADNFDTVSKRSPPKTLPDNSSYEISYKAPPSRQESLSPFLASMTFTGSPGYCLFFKIFRYQAPSFTLPMSDLSAEEKTGRARSIISSVAVREIRK